MSTKQGPLFCRIPPLYQSFPVLFFWLKTPFFSPVTHPHTTDDTVLSLYSTKTHPTCAKKRTILKRNSTLHGVETNFLLSDRGATLFFAVSNCDKNVWYSYISPHTGSGFLVGNLCLSRALLGPKSPHYVNITVSVVVVQSHAISTFFAKSSTPPSKGLFWFTALIHLFP